MSVPDPLWKGSERVQVSVDQCSAQLAVPVHKSETNLVVVTLSIPQLLVLVRAIREAREEAGFPPLRFPWDSAET